MKRAVYVRNTEDVSYALKNFPYFVINGERTRQASDYRKEIRQIKGYYLDYKQGADFITEGSGGKYVPSNVRFKNIRTLINKQARYMFSNMPDINIKSSESNEQDSDIAKQYQRIINKVIKDSKFPKKLLLGSKDCLIGKRICCVVDISEEGKILIHFYNSLQFYYELVPGSEEIKKLITFEGTGNLYNDIEEQYIVNRYELIESTNGNKAVSVSSMLYDRMGNVVETYIDKSETDYEKIPAVIITNDGLLDEKKGVSDVEFLNDYESIYSKVSNADIDAERQGMNPVRYVVDMNSKTTEGLSNGAGSFWDLKTEQNQNEVHPMIGTLAPSMNHTEPVKTTLERIRAAMYNEVDVPDISQEGLLSGITSYKALKALYFPLQTLCNERMKTWKPAIEELMRIVISTALLNRSLAQSYYTIENLKEILYQVHVSENYALLEDEEEQKASDITEVMNNARSRKSYIKKWRGEEFENDNQIDDELMQIAVENVMLDTLSANPSVSSELDKRYSSQNIDDKIDLQNSKQQSGVKGE